MKYISWFHHLPTEFFNVFKWRFPLHTLAKYIGHNIISYYDFKCKTSADSIVFISMYSRHEWFNRNKKRILKHNPKLWQQYLELNDGWYWCSRCQDTVKDNTNCINCGYYDSLDFTKKIKWWWNKLYW